MIPRFDRHEHYFVLLTTMYRGCLEAKLRQVIVRNNAMRCGLYKYKGTAYNSCEAGIIFHEATPLDIRGAADHFRTPRRNVSHQV